MTDKRQPVSDGMAQQRADDEEQQSGDNTPAPEQIHDNVAANAAQRRASLDKEIRAGWQRALGH